MYDTTYRNDTLGSKNSNIKPSLVELFAATPLSIFVNAIKANLRQRRM